MYFPYGTKELDYLSTRDPVLGAQIKRLGRLERALRPEPFAALINSIVGQQISLQAQESIWRRLEQLCGGISPHSIARQTEEALRGCGLSGRKASYIYEAAQRSLAGEINWQTLPQLTDEEIITQLCAFKGVGRWTAEMLLLFSLGRPDILSYDDLGIRRGLKKLHGHAEIDKKLFQHYQQLYSPYGSTAALYIWRIGAE